MAPDVNNINRVCPLLVHRATLPPSLMDRLERRRPKNFLHQLSHLNLAAAACLQLTDPCPNVAEEASGSLAIPKCDRANLLARSLYSPVGVVGGVRSGVAKFFDGAILR